jgi:hypothetical protein
VADFEGLDSGKWEAEEILILKCNYLSRDATRWLLLIKVFCHSKTESSYTLTNIEKHHRVRHAGSQGQGTEGSLQKGEGGSCETRVYSRDWLPQRLDNLAGTEKKIESFESSTSRLRNFCTTPLLFFFNQRSPESSTLSADKEHLLNRSISHRSI